MSRSATGQTRWELRAQEAPEHIKANWPGSAWIVEVITILGARHKWGLLKK
jgi:hypothetical protein